jgi:tRNA (cytidine/uridine-2'-O-)-methyltransferase
MVHVVLFQPEIPPNTGNVIRLCANTGTALHLIQPLGFDMDDSKLRRAGLDYREWATVNVHASLQAFAAAAMPSSIWAVSTRGRRCYSEVSYQAGDALLFGPETRGLPTEVLQDLGSERILRLPMVAQSRSLNLSNAVAVLVYEAWRQLGFAGSHRVC